MSDKKLTEFLICLEDEYDFVFGIVAQDNMSDSTEANLYTLNDLELVYNKKDNTYHLSIETIYKFLQGKKGEILYLKRLLKQFEDWMKSNNYNINYDIELYEMFTKGKNLTCDFVSVEEAFAYFKILVNGYCNSDS
jgi:hypothetical protein